jgi:hypothetical protein
VKELNENTVHHQKDYRAHDVRIDRESPNDRAG